MEQTLQLLTQPAAWAALTTLVAMEVVLGIDNLIFISILTNKLPEHQRSRARRIGIALALILRLALLGTIAVIVRLTAPLLINEVTMMVKASSLISVVGILELTRTAQNIATSTFQPLEIYLAAGVLYLVINGAVAYLGTVGHRQLAA